MVSRSAIRLDHECRWTRFRRTELSHRGQSVSGAGVPTAVLRNAALSLGPMLSSRPASDDPYGEEISLGQVAKGATHDGCFFRLEPASIELKRALLGAALDLHSYYLGLDVDWSRVLPALLDRWGPDVTVRMRSIPVTKQLRVRVHGAGAGLLARLFARPLRVNCSTGVAVFA
jgi:hypothetical protein